MPPTPFRRVAAAAATAATVTAGVIAGVVVAPGAGSGATPTFTDTSFVGYAGGTFVRAADNTVTSALTAESTLNTPVSPIGTSNDAASATVASLVTAGAVTTSVRTETIAGGYRVVSTARTAAINALGGAITANAVETVSTATVVNGVASQDTSTRLLGLKVAGRAIPVTVQKNFTIRIPGIATVAINYSQGGVQRASASTLGIGLYVSLLKPRGANAIGAELAISPTYAALAPIQVPDSGRYLGGEAYGTSVRADVGSLAGVRSDPTAPVGLGALGTQGVTKENSIAAVNLASALKIGAIRSTAVGVNTSSRYSATTTNSVAGVNLLGGAVTATALGARAEVSGAAGSRTPKVTGAATIANLTIGGQRIPVNAAPNTTLRLGSLATITVNQQVRTANSIQVRALVVVLTTAAYGLPVGARIEVASARASVS